MQNPIFGDLMTILGPHSESLLISEGQSVVFVLLGSFPKYFLCPLLFVIRTTGALKTWFSYGMHCKNFVYTETRFFDDFGSTLIFFGRHWNSLLIFVAVETHLEIDGFSWGVGLKVRRFAVVNNAKVGALEA